MATNDTTHNPCCTAPAEHSTLGTAYPAEITDLDRAVLDAVQRVAGLALEEEQRLLDELRPVLAGDALRAAAERLTELQRVVEAWPVEQCIGFLRGAGKGVAAMDNHARVLSHLDPVALKGLRAIVARQQLLALLKLAADDPEAP